MPEGVYHETVYSRIFPTKNTTAVQNVTAEVTPVSKGRRRLPKKCAVFGHLFIPTTYVDTRAP